MSAIPTVQDDRFSRRRRDRGRYVRLGVWVWAACSLFTTVWADGGTARPPADRPLPQLTAGYVSSATCYACHPGNYGSWHASFHRTMTQTGSPENIIPEMDGLTLSHDGWIYQVTRRNGTYQVQRRAEVDAAGGFSAPQEIVLTTGSHHLQIYWLATGDGRTLVQFPFAYIVAQKIWAPVIQTFLAPPEFKSIYDVGEWNGACMQCHTTAPRSRFVGGSRFDSQVAEFGIRDRKSVV